MLTVTRDFEYGPVYTSAADLEETETFNVYSEFTVRVTHF